MTQDAQEIVTAHWSKMAQGVSPMSSWTDSPTVLSHVNRMISGDANVILLEYVGPSQFQLTDKATRIINDLLEILPLTCRERSSLPGEYVTRFERNTVEQMNASDPSEAIRSADILPLLTQTFTILE